MSFNYNVINRYNTLFNKVQSNNNKNDMVVGDLKWSIRSDDFKGWLLCDGREMPISRYPELADLLEESFGPYGDGTFRLPDTRSKVMGACSTSALDAPTLSGSLTERTLGADVGEETHTLLLKEIPSHTHTHNANGGSTVGSTGLVTIDRSGTVTDTDSVTPPNETNEIRTNTPVQLTINNTGGNVDNSNQTDPHNNMQPTLFIGHVFIYGGDVYEDTTEPY
jgi:microcystin-dependent protein